MKVLAIVTATCLVVLGCGKSADTPDAARPSSAPAASEPSPQAPGTPVAASDPAPQPDPMRAMFETACSKCHDLARSEKYSGNETWEAIVTRMIEQRGAEIAANDRPRLVAYLERAYPKH